MITTIEKNGEKHVAIIFREFPIYGEDDMYCIAKSILSIFSFIFCCPDKAEILDFGDMQNMLGLYNAIMEEKEGGES